MRGASPRMLWLPTAIVAVSTVFLPCVSGYGTVLGQFVVLGAWSIVAALTSGSFADHHDGLVWLVSALLNVGLFLLPASAVALATRRWWPRANVVALAIWCVFYLTALFVLFPATDGP